MPYFWKQPPEPLGRYDDRGFCYECSEMAPCDCEPEPRIPLRLRFKQWRGRTAWKLDRLGRQLAFWQFPARIERVSIRCASLEAGLTGLGQTVGGLVAEKRAARDAELNAGFLAAHPESASLEYTAPPPADGADGYFAPPVYMTLDDARRASHGVLGSFPAPIVEEQHGA
jgi:hypothetical protein